MVGGPPGSNSFVCPICQAPYQVVKVERGRETTIDRELACLSCGAQLPGREGNFVLKYFMLRKAAGKKGWRRNEKPQPASARCRHSSQLDRSGPADDQMITTAASLLRHSPGHDLPLSPSPATANCLSQMSLQLFGENKGRDEETRQVGNLQRYNSHGDRGPYVA
jgi:hypothetical protein